MSNVFIDMESALQTQVYSVANGTPIQNENNFVYIPVIGTKYWRTTNLPAASQLVTTGALQKHVGYYQVDVFTPTDVGLNILLTDLDTIYTAFNTVSSLFKNDTEIIIEGVGRGKVVREEAWLHGFIQIEYMCYAH